MSCKHDCTTPPLFPRVIFNRPGLDRIDYRIGNYAEVRATLFDALNKQPALAAFTHRTTDDPAIALLEADSIVVDILSFYQALYANEAYLRTAQWTQSVTDLVRLGGYRLAPGIAGEATFALTIKGDTPVTVPAGFGLKAQIEGNPKPVDFETRAALLGIPALGTFALYRPRMTPAIDSGQHELRLSNTGLPLKKDDRLLLGVPTPSGSLPEWLDLPEIVTVEETWIAFGERHVRLHQVLQRLQPSSSLAAYKIGDAVPHFGHNAPAIITSVSSQGVPSTHRTHYGRCVDVSTPAIEINPALGSNQFPLDRESKAFAPGMTVLIQGRFHDTPRARSLHLCLVRRIASVESRSLAWGMLTGAGTVLTFTQSLSANVRGKVMRLADIRTLTVLPVLEDPDTAQAADSNLPQANGNQLRFYGRRGAAAALSGRRLLIDTGTGEPLQRHVLSVASPASAGEVFHDVVLSDEVHYADFGYDDVTTTVYGNVVDSSQGKTLDAIAIGSGDGRLAFQTFALPKPPLSYLFDASHTPAQVPALEIRVDGLRWTRVESLFGAGPLDTVYIVREDAAGASAVQFGDGKTGAKLASGRNNIVALQRVGSGAHGPLQANTKPQATGKLAPLDKVFLPLPVTIGAVPEEADNARQVAPVRLQSLGRLVSLADYEAETRMLPGVLKANALWDAPDGVPAIVLTVLTEGSSAEDLGKVRDALTVYSRCRGPARHPVIAVAGYRCFVHVNALVGFDSIYRTEDLLREIKLALGVTGEEGYGIDGANGLFGLNARAFNQSADISQLIGAIQNVSGVAWVQLRAACALPLGSPPETDPQLMALPKSNLIPSATIACPLHFLLALHARHLVLGFSAETSSTECAS